MDAEAFAPVAETSPEISFRVTIPFVTVISTSIHAPLGASPGSSEASSTMVMAFPRATLNSKSEFWIASWVAGRVIVGASFTALREIVIVSVSDCVPPPVSVVVIVSVILPLVLAVGS